MIKLAVPAAVRPVPQVCQMDYEHTKVDLALTLNMLQKCGRVLGFILLE
jgi:hypothetical protein